MINRTILVGRLTRDPVLRRTPQGHAVATFIIAVDRMKADAAGIDADFIPVICWNKLAENVAQYTVKGSLVGVDGKLRSRTYDKNGRRVYVVEVMADTVQFLDNRKKEEKAPADNFSNDSYWNDPPF